MTSHAEHGRHAEHRTTRVTSPVQLMAVVAGVAFLAVGVLGFVPGVTTDFDTMTFAGHESGAMLLGVFQVSVLHNVVHLLFGVAGLLLGRQGVAAARGFLVGGGLIYLVLWLYGLVVDQDSTANFVPLNNADQWLHLGLAVAMIVLGALPGSRTAAESSADPDAPGPIV